MTSVNRSAIDFDGEALKLVKDVYALSDKHQGPRMTQYRTDHALFNAILDMTKRDPDRANIFIPKIWSIVKTKVPRDVKALSGSRPYLPFVARREEFKDGVRVWVDVIDDQLEKANWFTHLSLATLLKTVYGTSYMDATPYYDSYQEPVMIQGPWGPEFQQRTVHRLRVRLQTYAPWEIFYDPAATDLEEKGRCRYVVKIQLVSKRDIIRLAKRGGYPGLDIQKLIDDEGGVGSDATSKHRGLEMLGTLGLSMDALDADIGILFRYESEDRYIDVWNNRIVLRDVPNPLAHKMINLSRYIHDVNAHTQNSFCGIGEVKINEILQEMLNDMHNQAFDAFNQIGQPVTYYRKESVSPNALVRTMGNKIAVELGPNERINDVILESFGQELPASHFALLETLEKRIDATAGQYDIQRGKPAPGGQTATEIVKLDERGDDRQELNIRYGENVFLASFGRKLIAMISASTSMDDIVEVVGQERAIMAFIMNPGELPGGYNFGFKGSDRVANLAVKQANWINLSGTLLKIPNVLPGALALKLLEVFEEDDEKSRQMVIPDEVMMQIQAQQAMIQQGAEGGGQPGNKTKPNTRENVAQDNARQIRGDA